MSHLLAQPIETKSQLADARYAAHSAINRKDGAAINRAAPRVNNLQGRLAMLSEAYYKHQEATAKASKEPSLGARARIILSA